MFWRKERFLVTINCFGITDFERHRNDFEDEADARKDRAIYYFVQTYEREMPSGVLSVKRV